MGKHGALRGLVGAGDLNEINHFLHREHIARLDSPLHYFAILKSLRVSAIRSFKIPAFDSDQPLRILKIIELESAKEVVALADCSIFRDTHRTLFGIDGDRTAIPQNGQSVPRDERVFVIELKLAVARVKVISISPLNLKKSQAINCNIRWLLGLLDLSGGKIDARRPNWQPARVIGSTCAGLEFGFYILIMLDREISLLKTSDF